MSSVLHIILDEQSGLVAVIPPCDYAVDVQEQTGREQQAGGLALSCIRGEPQLTQTLHQSPRHRHPLLAHVSAVPFHVEPTRTYSLSPSISSASDPDGAGKVGAPLTTTLTGPGQLLSTATTIAPLECV